MIKVVCVYCNKDMGVKEGNTVSGVSHSVCPVCYKKIMVDLNQERSSSTPCIKRI